MAELARRSKTSSGSRVLLLRQPARSVGAGHDATPLSVQLAIGVIVALGVVGTMWLIGFLGFHMGFVPLLGISELSTPPGGGLAAATALLTSIPRTILRMGIGDPLLLMLGFVAIAIPAGGLAAVRPASPGGPKPHVLTVVFSYSTAVGACVFASIVLWWLASPLRSDLIGPFPMHAMAATDWLAELRRAAALDVLLVTAMALWTVLIMKLTIQRWLRGLAAGFVYPVLLLATTAMAMSNGAVSQATIGRTVAMAFEGATADRVLVLGESHGQLATLRVSGDEVALELVEHPARLRVVDYQGLAEFIAAHE